MLRYYREYRTGETDGSEVLEHNHRIVANEQLIPRIIKRNRQAILVDPHYFYFFQRKRTGRRCSCFQVETSPDSLCQVCFGTGLVGGYEKFGTASEWFDSTYNGTRAVNVIPNWSDATRPVMFRLVDGARIGYVEFDWQIRPSVRVTDLFQVISRTGGTVRALIRTASESDFVVMSETTINERLGSHRATIRVEMSRTSTSDPTPLLSHVFVRYRLMNETRIRMDIPRQTESITLAEYGVFDSFTTITGWVTDEVKTVGTEDFFKRLEDGTMWKSIESQPNRPLLHNTSHDVTLRLIQSFENYQRFPTG